MTRRVQFLGKEDTRGRILGGHQAANLLLAGGHVAFVFGDFGLQGGDEGVPVAVGGVRGGRGVGRGGRNGSGFGLAALIV